MTDNKFYDEAPNIFQKARKEKNLTQEEAAEILNISVRSLQLIEADTRIPKLDVALRMAKLYEISLDEMIDMVELKIPSSLKTKRRSGTHVSL